MALGSLLGCLGSVLELLGAVLGSLGAVLDLGLDRLEDVLGRPEAARAPRLGSRKPQGAHCGTTKGPPPLLVTVAALGGKGRPTLEGHTVVQRRAPTAAGQDGRGTLWYNEGRNTAPGQGGRVPYFVLYIDFNDCT